MWVRSQDKERLVDLRVFEVDKECNSYTIKGYSDDWANTNNFHIVLGWYSTKEKALKVLDEIQFKIDDNYGDFSYDGYGDNHFIGSIYTTYNKVYQMPQDDEVN